MKLLQLWHGISGRHRWRRCCKACVTNPGHRYPATAALHCRCGATSPWDVKVHYPNPYDR